MKEANVSDIEISVVSPMRNEAACVREFCTRVDAVLRAITDRYEILAVNDGSTDGTEGILKEICDRNAAVQVITLARPVGQWAAIYAGLQDSRGQYVVIMDADLQHAPEDLPRLIERIKQGHDMVSGMRCGRPESLLYRRIPSAIANFLIRRVTGCRIRDMAGYQCLRADVAKSLRIRSGQHRFLPALVHLAGGDVAEVPVTSPPRFAGETHYSLTRSLDVILDIVLLWFERAFQSRPLYLIGRISMVLLIVGSLVMAWLLGEKIFLGEHMGTRPPFFASLLLLLSAPALFLIGFVLELVSEALNSVSNAKPYVIRSRYGSGRSEASRTTTTAQDHGQGDTG